MPKSCKKLSFKTVERLVFTGHFFVQRSIQTLMNMCKDRHWLSTKTGSILIGGYIKLRVYVPNLPGNHVLPDFHWNLKPCNWTLEIIRSSHFPNIWSCVYSALCPLFKFLVWSSYSPSSFDKSSFVQYKLNNVLRLTALDIFLNQSRFNVSFLIHFNIKTPSKVDVKADLYKVMRLNI